MKVSALRGYQEKPEKTGIMVWDRVRRIGWGTEFIIIPIAENHYAAVVRDSGGRWKAPIKIKNAMNRNFTKSELEQILGSLNDWEVVDG